MRQKRLALKAQAAVLEDLIGQYSAVLERLEAQAEPESVAFVSKREDLRHVLTELAERTSAIAATLYNASEDKAHRASSLFVPLRLLRSHRSAVRR